MRAIKFRAWDFFTKKYINRVLAGCNIRDDGYICNLVWDENKMDWIHFDEGCGVLEQFTGLYDKNGVEIYEGDEVYCVYDGILYRYIVVFDESELDFKATNGTENYGSNFQYLCCCDEVEVIGNIHDNQD